MKVLQVVEPGVDGVFRHVEGLARFLAGHAGPWVFDRIESLLARRGTTINISRDEAAFARDRLGVPATRQRVIHNPVRTDRFRPGTPEEKRAARVALNVPPDALAVGTVGRMTFQKDPETLYRAIAPLLRRRPDLFLLHLGEGELHDELKSLCAALKIDRQVRFSGYAEDPLAFYHSLDALAMTSRYEAGWPIVTLEGLACGLPIVSSRAPGTADIDKAGLSHCWTAEAGDLEGFEAAISALLEDLPKQRPSNHRELALRRFSPEACYGAVLDEYESAASSQPHERAPNALGHESTDPGSNRRNLELD
jgi:glycosyltransferase involved in cell wall biosynthesis